MIKTEVEVCKPLLLCSAPGFDASAKVDSLAAESKVSLKALAMGSSEGYAEAESAIESAARSGSWVVLKNVHLSPEWLANLEKKLHALTPTPNFRLFLAEIHPKLPTSLVRKSHLFIFEPALGIRDSMLRSFALMPATRMEKQPVERARLTFSLRGSMQSFSKGSAIRH